MFAHFQHGGQEPEVVKYLTIYDTAGPCNELIIASAHDNPMVGLCMPRVGSSN